ncbi:hypothetical protein B0H16DRAFT_1632055 [Mycena metata]|uniref:Uncharacterized protein n=1 Tax=Mycena metata TaxID=1033252 RepID=A0AAD7MAP9_9AGAR|nr:hypothetical protein B0H16DRAFT_1632055 [Mycena metata]
MRSLLTITLFTIRFCSSSGKHAARGARHRPVSGSSSTLIPGKLAVPHLRPRALGATGNSATFSASDVGVTLLLASTPTPTPTSPPPGSGPTLGSGGPDFPPSAPPTLPISSSTNTFLSDAHPSVSSISFLLQSQSAPPSLRILQELALVETAPERRRSPEFGNAETTLLGGITLSGILDPLTSVLDHTTSVVDPLTSLLDPLTSLLGFTHSASRPQPPPPPPTTLPGAGGSGAPSSAPSFIPTPIPSPPSLTGTSSTVHSSASSLSSLSFPITAASPSALSGSPSINDSIPATASSAPTAATSSAPTAVSRPAAGATIRRSNHTAFVVIGILIPLLAIALAINIYQWRRRRRRLAARLSGEDGNPPALEDIENQLNAASASVPQAAQGNQHSEFQDEKQPESSLYSIPIIPVPDEHSVGSAALDAPLLRPPSPSASAFGEPLPPYSRPLPRVPLAS